MSGELLAKDIPGGGVRMGGGGGGGGIPNDTVTSRMIFPWTYILLLYATPWILH